MKYGLYVVATQAKDVQMRDIRIMETKGLHPNQYPRCNMHCIGSADTMEDAERKALQLQLEYEYKNDEDARSFSSFAKEEGMFISSKVVQLEDGSYKRMNKTFSYEEVKAGVN